MSISPRDKPNSFRAAASRFFKGYLDEVLGTGRAALKDPHAPPPGATAGPQMNRPKDGVVEAAVTAREAARANTPAPETSIVKTHDSPFHIHKLDAALEKIAAGEAEWGSLLGESLAAKALNARDTVVTKVSSNRWQIWVHPFGDEPGAAVVITRETVPEASKVGERSKVTVSTKAGGELRELTYQVATCLNETMFHWAR